MLCGAALWALRTACIVKSRISGKDADTVARHALKRHPIRLLAPEGVQEPPGALVPSDGLEQERKAPPRVRKPSPLNDQCLALTPTWRATGRRFAAANRETVLRGTAGVARQGGNFRLSDWKRGPAGA
jgi:hypothetical protein